VRKLTQLETSAGKLTFTLLAGVLSLSSITHGAEAKGDLNFNYNIDTSLIYYDRFDPADAISQLYGNDQLQPLNRKWTRRPGLERIRFDFSWRYFAQSSFDLSLRPDAAMDRFDPFFSKAREIDTRAGDSYRSRPTISLLDLYALHINTSDNFTVSLGVFDRLEPSRATFRSLLDFGLDVQMPRKFSALKFRLDVSPLPIQGLNSAQTPRYVITGFVFEGRDDRNERLAPQHQPTDFGPSAMDPYLGTAITLDSIQNDKWQFNAMIGNLDSQSSIGTINETFASISAIWKGKALGLDSRVSYWGKWSKERWNSQEPALPELEQLSHGFSGIHKINDTQEVFWGMEYGVSERLEDEVENAVVSYRGEKLDLGLKMSLPGRVSIETMLSTERRQKKQGELSVGAFAFNDQDNRSRLTRLGIRMSYDIH
jgi:hypothetical protein